MYPPIHLFHGPSHHLDDDLGIRTFFKAVILEGVGDRDLRPGGGTMKFCFVDGEDYAEKKGSVC